jgi:16S rRNA (cytosine967-C5)-methyltransferase
LLTTIMPISPARKTAFDILLRVDQENAYASELLHSGRCSELSALDQGLTTELVMGVLRWKALLDAAIAKVASQPPGRLDPEVLTALRMGAYQLGWLDRVPARAAIHESVELVKRSHKRSAAPFVNAVLRKLIDSSIPPGTREELINSASNAEALATASAHPSWLVQRWIVQYGLEIARNICRYDQAIPVTTIRLRSASGEDELRGEGIEIAAGSYLRHARRIVAGDVTKTKAFAQGHLVIQDEASQLVAALLGRGKRVLDCCAAPGGKTWAIADRNPGAEIVAIELHRHRAEILRKRILAKNVQVTNADIRSLLASEPFDRVLVDVPCSGTGTMARNPEIKSRLVPEDLSDLPARQLQILQSAMKHVAPSGMLIYATCSLEREEGESVVERAMQENASFGLLEVRSSLEALRDAGEFVAQDFESLIQGPYLRTIPGVHACDGFFVAMLERIR